MVSISLGRRSRVLEKALEIGRKEIGMDCVDNESGPRYDDQIGWWWLAQPPPGPWAGQRVVPALPALPAITGAT